VSRKLRVAVIADDYTGGSDAASMLVRAGAGVMQTFGVPPAELVGLAAGECDAVVASLKCRSVASAGARAMVRATVEALRPLAAAQWQYKYCSTFDSTDAGNIGPVCEELLDALGEEFTIAAPALPVNGRTQYRGYLFVLGELLSESPLKDHPLNPMREANLVRHLQKQTARRVGLVSLEVVRRGAEAVRAEMERLRAEGIAIALADAVMDEDLAVVAEASGGLQLVTGGSGITAAMPGVWGDWRRGEAAAVEALKEGMALLIAGSCSAATRKQIEVWRGSGGAVIVVDARKAAGDAAGEAQRLMGLVKECLAAGRAPLVASSAAPGEQVAGAAEGIEEALALVARRAHDECGVRRFAVAGGETSGAVIDALGLRAAKVVKELSPGVPVLRSVAPGGLGLILKSGNFGPPEFFEAARAALER
jgi:uncharacterized protein YgbK (DUF1537 family)